MKNCILSILLCLFTLKAISQGIINNVSFEFDENWKVAHKPDLNDSTATIVYRYLGDTSYTFIVNALVKVNYVPKTIKIDQIPIDYLAERIGMNRILTASEGSDWKSSIFVANEKNSQHITFHRTGLINGVILELMLFFENKGKENDLKVLTLDEQKVSGQMSGLVVSESLGKNMIDIYKEVCQTLEIFTEKEDSFSFVLIESPSSPAKVFRKSKN